MPRHLRASNSDTRQCASHQCTKPAIRACHVILANQNLLIGKRYIVYLCDGCNKNYRGAFNIRANAECHELIYCDCGWI